jgi:hypothetical protein
VALCFSRIDAWSDLRDLVHAAIKAVAGGPKVGMRPSMNLGIVT